MNCNSCGAILPPSATMCPNCGMPTSYNTPESMSQSPQDEAISFSMNNPIEETSSSDSEKTIKAPPSPQCSWPSQPFQEGFGAPPSQPLRNQPQQQQQPQTSYGFSQQWGQHQLPQQQPSFGPPQPFGTPQQQSFGMLQPQQPQFGTPPPQQQQGVPAGQQSFYGVLPQQSQPIVPPPSESFYGPRQTLQSPQAQQPSFAQPTQQQPMAPHFQPGQQGPGPRQGMSGSITPSSSGAQEEAAPNYGLPTFPQAQVPFFASAPMHRPPAQQLPQLRRGISGAMIAVIVMLALLLIGGSIFAYYVAVVQPAQLHAQATADAQTSLTAQARGTVQAQTRATTQAQATATATTPEVLYAQATSGMPVINDPLSDKNTSSWNEAGKQGNGCTFTGGSYHISATQQGFFSCLAGPNSVSDFAFQVQMSIVKGDGGGIDFRISNGPSSTIDAYFLNVSSTGEYALLVSQNGSSKLLMRGTSSALKQGLNQPNLLTVIARGESIYLYLNKQFVTSIKDTTYGSGSVGLFVSDLQRPSEVAFSNAELWVL